MDGFIIFSPQLKITYDYLVRVRVRRHGASVMMDLFSLFMLKKSWEFKICSHTVLYRFYKHIESSRKPMLQP